MFGIKLALVSILASAALAQQSGAATSTGSVSPSQSGLSSSATASATIFVPVSVPVLLSPFIKSVTASVIGADACGVTYGLTLTNPITLAATVTQGPSAYMASLNYEGPEVATCNFLGTTSATCNLSGRFIATGIQNTYAYSGNSFTSQLYTVPITAGADMLSKTSGSCTKSASPLPSLTSSSSGSGSSMSTSSSAGNAGAPMAVIKTIYKVAVVPAAMVAGAALI